VRPHEPSLRSYLRSSFPAVHDVDDVVQESYLRVWRTRATQPVRSARAFLFTVARRLALDLLRRDRNSPVVDVGSACISQVVEEKQDLIAQVGRREKVRLLAEAIAALPERRREIFFLHKIEGLSRKEVAMRLGVSDKTVETQTARAMRACEEFFRRKGMIGLFHDGTR